MEYKADDVFKSAAACAALGWKIVRLYGVRDNGHCTCAKGPECRTPGKHPSGGGSWQLRATDDEEEISSWFDFTDSNPSRRVNVGVLLGKASGLMDVEADNEEAKRIIKANGLDLIPTCRYRSTRGEHHLFQLPEGMPDTAVIHVGELEVRLGGGGKAAQSVLPMSWHGSGIQYQWLPGCRPDEIAPAPLPDAFLKLVIENTPRSGGGVIASAVDSLHGEPLTAGGRHAFLLGMASLLAGTFHRAGRSEDKELDNIRKVIHSLNVTHCNPPKDRDEIDAICRSQWAHYREVRFQAVARRPLEQAGLDYDEARHEYGPGRWRLTVIHSEPKSYRLAIPNVRRDLPPHQIHIESAKFLQASRDMAAAILAGTDRLDVLDPDPKTWARVWNGETTTDDQGQRIIRRSLRLKLLDEADEEYPAPDESDLASAAEMLLTYLESFEKESADEGEDLPIDDGTPRWLECGDTGEWKLYLKITITHQQACRRANVPPWTTSLWRRLSAAWRAECDPSILGADGKFPKISRKSTAGKVGKFNVMTDETLEALGRVARR